MEKLDVELYLEARKHYDYIWFEMQHATLTYADGTLQRLFLCAVRLLPKPQRSVCTDGPEWCVEQGRLSNVSATGTINTALAAAGYTVHLYGKTLAG